MGRFAKVLAEIAKRLKSDGEFTLEKRIAAYKVALKENSDFISTRKRDILYPGLTEGRERAESLDDFLIHILDEAAAAANTGKSTPPVMIVVALGGYGRMELNPISDVDVTFIHGGGAKFPAGFEFIVRDAPVAVPVRQPAPPSRSRPSHPDRRSQGEARVQGLTSLPVPETQLTPFRA